MAPVGMPHDAAPPTRAGCSREEGFHADAPQPRTAEVHDNIVSHCGDVRPAPRKMGTARHKPGGNGHSEEHKLTRECSHRKKTKSCVRAGRRKGSGRARGGVRVRQQASKVLKLADDGSTKCPAARDARRAGRAAQGRAGSDLNADREGPLMFIARPVGVRLVLEQH